MLAEGRPEVIDPPRGPGEEGEDGRHGHLADPLVLELEEVAPRRVLLVLEDVRDAVDRPTGHLARAAPREHLGLGKGGGPLRDHLVHRRPVLEPVRDRPVAVGRGELRPAHRVRESLEHAIVGARDRHPLAVRGGVVAVGHHVHRVGPHSLAHIPGVGVGDGHFVEVTEDRLVEGDVDVLARARALRRPERHQHPERPVGAREVVAEGGRARHEGRTVRLTREVAQPAEGVGDAGEPRVAGLRSRLPEAGDADHHEPRVHRAQVLPADAPPLEGPGAEVLDEHVGLGDEPLQELRALPLSEIEGDRLLVARLLEPDEGVPGVARARGPEAPQRVADPRLLDLDDLRPELREEGAAEGRGEEGRGVEDPHPIHRTDGPRASVRPARSVRPLPPRSVPSIRHSLTPPSPPGCSAPPNPRFRCPPGRRDRGPAPSLRSPSTPRHRETG